VKTKVVTEAEDATENVVVDEDVMINQEVKDDLVEAKVLKTKMIDVADVQIAQNLDVQNLLRIDQDVLEENK
jgi:hypothetical protein